VRPILSINKILCKCSESCARKVQALPCDALSRRRFVATAQPPSNSRPLGGFLRCRDAPWSRGVSRQAWRWRWGGRPGPWARAPARRRGGVRWHTAARTPVASHSQPLSLRRGVGCPGGGKFTYLLTARPTPRRVCTNRRTRGAPRPDADTRSHVATCNTTWRRGRGASPPSLDRPRDGACAPRDASCMQPHSRTGFLLGWGMGPHCTV
jgi:hypothetical protein